MSDHASSQSRIIYTKTDEAPALATRSLYPIFQKFLSAAGVSLEIKDISLAARTLANLSEYLPEEQRVEDALKQLGNWVTQPDANIIKLPNISASVPQLKATIAELQAKGIALPNYPDEPKTEEEKKIKSLYAKVLGSAVNPVLREGNSDRRAPKAVKNFAKKNPHKMEAWQSDSRSEVAHMQGQGDFLGSEQSHTFDQANTLTIQHLSSTGETHVLKDGLAVLAGEIVDAARMSKQALCDFFDQQIEDARQNNQLFSLHLKATMMKISDPIIFGHGVQRFFHPVFEKWGNVLNEIGVNPNNGLGNLYNNLEKLPENQRQQIEADIQKCYESRPRIAMVDSDKGITNLHVPSDVIVDASMPAMIRNSGQMWAADGQSYDTKAVIPDSTYAKIYQSVIDFCKQHGAFDPTQMGTVPNVGLMAQKAEEYGSHDKTFEIATDGRVQVIDDSGNVLIEHEVKAGDIWRMCQVKDAPIRDWVALAVRRSRLSQTPVIFWLDGQRPHDAQLILKVKQYLAQKNTEGLDIQIKSPVDAIQTTMERLIQGLDTISATGNVLRDYLTDLFPILELGTSAKMLSIVPLMNGGGLFETGAGGSAPKHAKDFRDTNRLRWDSLGEFLAMGASLEHLGQFAQNTKASVLADTLDQATEVWLANNRAPKRKVGELDNRGSHFYLALYWAQALAQQSDDPKLQSSFTTLAQDLADHEQTILDELIQVQGQAVDIGGYYEPDEALGNSAMRPSATLNRLLAH